MGIFCQLPGIEIARQRWQKNNIKDIQLTSFLPRIEITRQRRIDNHIKDIDFPYFAARLQSSAKKSFHLFPVTNKKNRNVLPDIPVNQKHNILSFLLALVVETNCLLSNNQNISATVESQTVLSHEGGHPGVVSFWDGVAFGITVPSVFFSSGRKSVRTEYDLSPLIENS